MTVRFDLCHPHRSPSLTSESFHMAVIPRLATYQWLCSCATCIGVSLKFRAPHYVKCVLPPPLPWRAGGGALSLTLTSRASSRASSRVTKRMLKLGIGPDGKPLTQPNKKKLHPRMYPVLVVNQDGSTYTVRHRTPLQILPLPLDPSTLTVEEREERERARRAAKERVYVEEEVEEDGWDQDEYRELIDR